MSESKMSNRNLALGILAVLVIGTVITMGLYAWFNPSKDMVGDYEVGKVYSLAFTQQYQDAGGMAGQTFMLRNTCGFSVPLRDPRGARSVFTAAEFPEDLPDSSFKLVRLTSPTVTVGAATIQQSYSYVVVVYTAKMGKQEFVPVFDPNNTCQ